MPAFEYLSPEQQAQAYYLYQRWEKEKRRKKRTALGFAGILAANVLGAKAAISKSQPMTDAQLRRKKSAQAKLSTGSAIAGLTGLTGLGTAAIVRKNPKTLIKFPVLGTKIKAQGADKVADSLKDKSYIAGAMSTGIGGIGSLNFAQIQRAEAHKRNQAKPKS